MVELDSNDLEQFVKFHTGENISKKRSAWDKFKSWDKLLLLLLALAGVSAGAALFVLLTPLVNFSFRLLGLYIEGWVQVNQWLLEGERGLGVAIVLGIFSILFLILARFRYLRDRSAYVDAGCPECHEHELIRIRRSRRDRIIGFFGIPIRRYACRNCTWLGLRLSGHSPHRFVELEDDEIDFGASRAEILPEVENIETIDEFFQETP